MASRTFDDIVTEGMLKAGRDDLASRIRGYFNDWLARQARSWAWPVLTRVRQSTVPAGSLTHDMVATTGPGVWSRILDNNWLYRTDRSARQRLRIMQVDSPPVGILDGGLTGQNTGLPTTLTLFRDSGSASGWSGMFDRATDREYILVFNPVEVPERIVAPWTDVPWYPEDDTCIQAVMTETLLYMNGPEDASYQAALTILGTMVSADRVRHGNNPSQNVSIPLNPGMFR